MKVLEKFMRDDLLRSGSLMLFASLATGGINFLFHMFMGGMLEVTAYGEFGALFAMSFFIFSILNRTIKISSANFISEFKGKKRLDSIPYFHSKLFIRMVAIGVIGLLIFSSFSRIIADFLNINSITLVLPIGIVLFISCIYPVNLGTIQGLQRFKGLAIINVSQASGKIGVGVILVLIGFGIYGAVAGVVAGPVIGFLISFLFIRDFIRLPGFKGGEKSMSFPKPINSEVKTPSGKRTDFNFKDIYKFSFPVLISIAFLTMPTNIDVVLVKHFFSDAETGLYTAASIFGKIIYFLPIGLTTVMFPKIVERHTANRNTRRILIRTLLYTGLLTGIGAIFFWLFPKFFLGLPPTWGDKYLPASSLLKYYGIAMFFFSLTAVLVYYNLALNRYQFIYGSMFIAVISLILICIYHSKLIHVLQIFLLSNIVLFTLMCISVFDVLGSTADQKR